MLHPYVRSWNISGLLPYLGVGLCPLEIPGRTSSGRTTQGVLKRWREEITKERAAKEGFYVNNCQRARTLNSTKEFWEAEQAEPALAFTQQNLPITGYSYYPRAALEWRGRSFALDLLACPPVEQNGVQQTRVFQNPNIQMIVFEPACKGGVRTVWWL